MFLDAAYVTKYYLNEPDSPAVRKVIASADSLTISALTIVEYATAARRHLRKGKLTVSQFQKAIEEFRIDVENGTWTIAPVTETLFWRTAGQLAGLPPGVLLRAGDAIQLLSARESGEHEIWTNDHHLLAAAPHVGLTGRSA
ncbi:MAG TPA: type II toxin-antitoxin system VapC family toxin [Candidatus Solibacter sp.]|nr:type II toxin-antitoxin system VapC family toxin [Candidatus Solibacter sp.]